MAIFNSYVGYVSLPEDIYNQYQYQYRPVISPGHDSHTRTLQDVDNVESPPNQSTGIGCMAAMAAINLGMSKTFGSWFVGSTKCHKHMI